MKKIFISHIVDEKEVAFVLKKILAEAFMGAVEIFVSSDGESLPGGKEWFTFVRNRAREADVILCLLSLESIRSSWVMFEAGIGDGAGGLVIPVLVGGNTFNELDFPMAGFQGRKLSDLGAILRDVGARIAYDVQDVNGNLKLELEKVHDMVPRSAVEMELTLTGKRVGFVLHNRGTREVELIDVKITASLDILDESMHHPSQQSHIFSAKIEEVAGRRYRVLRLNTAAVTRSSTGIDPLPELFTLAKSPFVLQNVSLLLKDDALQRHPEEKIETTISAKRRPPVVRALSVAQIYAIVWK